MATAGRHYAYAGRRHGRQGYCFPLRMSSTRHNGFRRSPRASLPASPTDFDQEPFGVYWMRRDLASFDLGSRDSLFNALIPASSAVTACLRPLRKRSSKGVEGGKTTGHAKQYEREANLEYANSERARSMAIGIETTTFVARELRKRGLQTGAPFVHTAFMLQAAATRTAAPG